MPSTTLNPVTNGAGFALYTGALHNRSTASVILQNGTPSGGNPHRRPFLFFPYASLVGKTITKVELLWSLSAAATPGTVGIGFHGATLADANSTLFNALDSIGNGEATQVVNSETLGPFATDLGAGGISAVDEAVGLEIDIAMGMDTSEASTWACTLSTYQLRVTYDAGKATATPPNRLLLPGSGRSRSPRRRLLLPI